jgi:predicted nucleotidyltransferase
VHRQLRRFADVGLVVVTPAGNQRLYQVNPRAPIYGELRSLVAKTVGLVEPLRRALAPFAEQIVAAFVYGSVAKGADRAGSDVDLMIVTDTLRLADVYDALAEVERELERRIEPRLLTLGEWRSRRSVADSFTARVAEGPRLLVLGSDDALA